MARILLADDDKAMRDFVKRALEADGHHVAVAHDGTEALERLSAPGGTADVLVTDVNMPGLDGVSLAGRAAGMTPSLRVLFMSGFPEELERAKGIKAAKVGTLSKPFSLEQVKAAVRGLLG